MRCGTILGVLFLVGCASSENWYLDAGSEPTPDGWEMPAETLVIVVTDERREPLGSFKLRLTNEHVETIEPESWFAA